MNKAKAALVSILLSGLLCLSLSCWAEGGRTDTSSLVAAAPKGEGPVDATDLLKVVEAFFEALKKGNLSQAYYGYTSKEFREVTKFPQFKQFVQRFPSLDRFLSYKNLTVEHYDTLASVNVLALSNDRKENVVDLDAIWEAGKWRILGIQVYLKPPNIPH